MLSFDCNASFGVMPHPPPSPAMTPEALLAERDHRGVDEALVTCAAQCFDPPSVSHGLSVEQVRDWPHPHPAWALLPTQAGEMPEPDRFVGQMGENGGCALWAWPSQHCYLLGGCDRQRARTPHLHIDFCAGLDILGLPQG